MAWSVVGRQDTSAAMGEVRASSAPSATASAPPAEDRLHAQVDAVLKVRASAVLAGKLPQFLATVDPRNKKLRQQQQVLFGNLRKIGLRKLTYEREPKWAPEPQPQHGPSAHAFRVQMMVQIAGIDPAPRAVQLGYTFVERGGRLLLVDDDDLNGSYGRGTYLEPWDLGAIEAIRKPGVLVVVPAGERANGERLAREARAAAPGVRAATRRAQAAILVIAMADRRSMDPEWQSGGHPAAAVAAYNLAPIAEDPRDMKVVGSRVVIHPDQRKKAGRLLLAHEFTHAAMAPLGFSAPTWLVEGLAMYAEMQLAEQRGYDVSEPRDELLDEAIPQLDVLPIDGVFHGEYDEDSYGVSWILVEFLMDKYGQKKVNALYADLAQAPEDPTLREQLLRKHLKLSETAFVAAVKKYDGPS
ncbi:peptidase MA family metallohydrolase [Kribbella sancticallisti]|uniref:peptidase MA family metallohydrolase n=1 Tax=Kribbella sancticallisti TaxID=460087 RepID=UPI0031D001CB